MPESHSDLDWPAYAVEMGHRLAAVRRAQHVTQLELALAAGITRNQVQNIERSRSFRNAPGNTTIRTVFLLAQALGVPPRLLLPDLEAVPARQGARIDAHWPRVRAELLAEVERHPVPETTRTSTRV